MSPRRETPYTPDNQRIPDHEHSVQCPPSQRHAAGHQGKGRFVCCVHSLFCRRWHFVPTQRDYKLGDDVYVLLTLPEDTQRYPVAGRVAWVTPARAAGNRTQGVGIQFPKDEKSRLLKLKIEEILGTALGSERPTQTI